jgi:hypothetical protein
MNFTFGIITNGDNPNHLDQVIKSILRQGIPEFEIIVVGGKRPAYPSVNHILFNEFAKPMWITKKKNLITAAAKYENIVYLHDYIILSNDWYDGYVKFGNAFNVCINPLINGDGSRYRDLTLFPSWHTMEAFGLHITNSCNATEVVPTIQSNECLIPYTNYKECQGLTKYMYISGAYWVAKKHVMQEFPLDEKLVWGKGEDVQWSDQLKSKYTFSFNNKSNCLLLKHKNPSFTELSVQTVSALQKIGLLV